MVETAFVTGVDQEALFAFLNKIPSIWKKNSAFFEGRLIRLVREVARKGDLLFIVDVYSNGYEYPTIITLFIEYQSDLFSAAISIYATCSNPIIRLNQDKSLREIESRLGDCFERIDDISEEGIISFKADFECPNCKARYSSRTLTRDGGKVQCQSCGKWIDLDAGHR